MRARTMLLPFLLAAATLAQDATRLPLLLRKLDRTLRVLYVTAHPDDEDEGLLCRLTHGDGIETALLTLTRGEGGQNEIGPELGHALGVLRARELEAVHRITGVTQFFARAHEFGYSFSVEETFARWGKERMLRDIVQVIRLWAPDVILTMNPEGKGGGQHHQASALLAREAFDLAADPKRWPELGPAHATARIFHSGGGGQAAATTTAPAPGEPCETDLSARDPILGATWAELGVRARSEHRCQGMTRAGDPFDRRVSRLNWWAARGERMRPLAHPCEGLPERLLDGPAGPTPLGEKLRAAARALRQLGPGETPERLLTPLLKVSDLLPAAGDDGLEWSAATALATLRARFAEAVQLAAGLHIAARSDRVFAAAGDTVRVRAAATNTGSRELRVRLLLRGPGVDEPSSHNRGTLWPLARWEETIPLRLPATAEPTIARPVPPLSAGGEAGAFLFPGWSAFALGGRFELDGRVFELAEVPIEHVEVEADFPEVRRSDLHVVPEPAIRPGRESVVAVLTDDGQLGGEGEFLVRSLRGGKVTVALLAADGFQVEPASQVVETRPGGGEVPVRFRVRAPAGGGECVVTAEARSGTTGAASRAGYQVVDYPHLRRAALLCEARLPVRAFPCRVPKGVRVGYVDGPGDEVAQCLPALGVAPVHLSAADLQSGDLSRFDVILTGIRAYKTRDDLRAAQQRLLQWVEAGGTLIVQYNKTAEFNRGGGREGSGREAGGREASSPLAPWPAVVSDKRITAEDAPVTIKVPGHPVFLGPNPVTPEVWQGWVQERTTYMLDAKDERYADLLELEDLHPYNAGKKTGALVEARLGKGRWVYVGLTLFRQLPAGVPGSYRLLANLLALGRS